MKGDMGDMGQKGERGSLGEPGRNVISMIFSQKYVDSLKFSN